MIRDDLKFALRGLRRDPLYAAAVVATLAVTLGASTAIFSIVNGVLLRPLPYRQAGRLVSIREIVPQWTKQYPTLPANARHFEEWRNRATSFAAMAALDWRTTTVAGAGEPVQATILRASGTLFDVLQVPVALGRPLDRGDERLDHPRVTLISDALWGEQFGRRTTVLGRRLVLGGTDYTIVGVLPPRFDVPAFDVLGDGATLRSNVAAVVPFRLNVADIGWMGTFNYPVIARLRDGATIDRARAELDVLQQDIVAIARRDTPDTTGLRGRITRLDDAVVGRTRLGLLLLLGAVASVVLIACANLANLSLTRTLGRLRDAAVRSALGASQAGLVRTIVLEHMVLAIAGGALGVAVAREALLIFVRTAPIDLPRVNDVVIDGRVIAFAVALAVAAGLAVALLPAWRIGRGDIQSMLRGGGHGTTDRGGVRARGVLLSLQVAISITLLVVTGLFVASFVRLVRIDPGFSTEQVVTIEIAPAAARYPDTNARAALYDRIGERARYVPGITAVAWTSALPLTGETWVDGFARVDDPRPGAQKPNANYRFVGPDYFRALSMPILQGRSLDERDRRATLVPTVISARAAQTLWPGDNPIGKPFGRGTAAAQFEVVGVVVDGHPTALETDSPLMVYVPYWFNNDGRSVLVARTSADPAATIRDVSAIVRDLDREIAIGHSAPLGDLVDKAVEGRRYQASLFIAFGIIALLIATTGV